MPSKAASGPSKTGYVESSHTDHYPPRSTSSRPQIGSFFVIWPLPTLNQTTLILPVAARELESSLFEAACENKDTTPFPPCLPSLVTVSGRAALRLIYSLFLAHSGSPHNPPTLSASHHSRSLCGPLAAFTICLRPHPLDLSLSLSLSARCSPHAPQPASGSPPPHMPRTRPHVRTRLERSEHSNEDGTALDDTSCSSVRLTTARSCERMHTR